ncbi:Adenylate and Guanylate cyclase catalytic domain containing protein [Trichomonas vaginalis G3]|uniref:Adenylate and Guanylate cyclase catalytic domain containing protein n=1 Tax=Trichomonas vaginalis (strain ATCC PRA-98 / G3) TaxID=412133 RepID=A2F426_TRIV3|nr:guanylate cyclase protein [Trichomonas vaginalis G3]EAY00327.1 Adenylate and Guanylate cyclase catalytic domain containing protein [Trichomonas vaginalis G3]KAI5508401.1 guanylate cyclase protein [Trichomonas vaginalis G3]|eukprot:XP_001313256.1 Adenylate and Guanylate cyclase catalytic domain containing protein [Trichomonas vaginalis G3]
MDLNNQGGAVSQSISADSSNQNINIEDSKSSIDEMFPLFLQIFQQVKIPVLMLHPFLVVFFFQTLLVSIWPWSKFWETHQDHNVIHWLRTVLFFVPKPYEAQNYLIVSVVFTFFNLSSFVLVRFQIAYYNMKRKFVSILNYPIRAYFDTILVATLVPSMVLAGETFLRICHKDFDWRIILSMLLFMVSFIYQIYSFIIVQGLASKSIVVNVTPLLNFDPSIMGLTIAILLVTIIPYFVLLLFEAWAQLFAVFFHIGLYTYLIYYNQKFIPFVDIQTMALATSWQIACLVGDINLIIGYFYDGVHYLVPILCALCFFLGLTPAGLVLFTIRTKRMVAKLSLEFKTQDEAFEYFKELGLDLDVAKAQLYLRTSFQNYCPAFYQWHLVNFIAEHYDDEISLSTCLQLVNFFPKETRLQNKLQRLLLKRRKVGYVTRFLNFEVDAIKILRQFSVSTASKLKLIELKTMSRQCENMTRAAIDSPLSAGYFEGVATKTQMARAIWKEALQNAPNNPKFCEEYSRYLIECECDFPEGIKIKNKQQIIEMGSNFVVDYSFRSMVAVFSKYITDGILNLQGGVVKTIANNTKASGSQSNNSSNNSGQQSSGSVGDDMTDADLEDYIGKQAIKLSRTRLALHRALENKVAKSIKAVNPASIFIMIYVIIVIAVGFTYASQKMKSQVKLMSQLNYSSQNRFYTACANIAIIAAYFTEDNGIIKYAIPVRKYYVSDDIPYVIFNLPNLLPQVTNFTTQSLSNLNLLMSSMVDLATQGEDVYNIASQLMNPIDVFQVCAKTKYPFSTPSFATKGSLTSLITLLTTAQREYSGHTTTLDALISDDTCELTVNFQSYFAGVTALFDELDVYQNKKGTSLNDKFKLLEIVIPVVTFVVVFAPVFIIHFLTVRSLNKLIEIIKSFDSKAKLEAKDSILVNPGVDDARMNEMNASSMQSIVLMLCACFVSLIFLGINLIGWLMTSRSNTRLLHINKWNEFASKRLSLSAELMNMLVTLIVIHDEPNKFFLTDTTLVSGIIKLLLNQLTTVDNYLVNGVNETPACKGFDKELDNLNVIDAPLPEGDTDEQDVYRNASIHQQIQILQTYVQSILTSVAYNTTIQVTDVSNAFYLANFRMFHKLEKVTQRLLELGQIEKDKIHTVFYILIGVAIASLIAWMIIITMYYNIRVSAYKAALFIIKRFSPYTLINNKMFNKVFLKEKGANKNEKLTIEGSIIMNANDSIFCTSLIGTVEIVNNAVPTLLGYTPEQILGQRITEFFTQKDGDTIMQKLEQMKSGQSSSFFEDDFVAVSDSSQEIPVHVTIIGMKKEGSDDVNSFVLVLRDQTALVNQKKQAEEAKAKSEKLLYQILPRDIVVQLNRGEKDISFVVPSATIVFIDINKFSEYSSNLSPQDIMANLSFYFACIDKIAAKYNMLTKIKLIGDIYMAATGLFNPDAQPESHAEQTILFGIDCVNTLDEVNIKLEANLAIRIGINSGGPVIAGVLGTDKPVFDIIGDPINVAARLQTTCEINHVHISQATYDLVKGMNFELTQRGETFLKGKGKQMTYYVTHPGSTFNTEA